MEKVQVVSGPLIYFHLLRFCQNTRSGFLDRNVPPKVLASGPGNVLLVDTAIVKAILQRGFKNMNTNCSATIIGALK